MLGKVLKIFTKIISADIKADVKQTIKQLVAVSHNILWIFNLILVGIPSSLILSIKTRGEGFFYLIAQIC